jgi:hypothetical protein
MSDLYSTPGPEDVPCGGAGDCHKCPERLCMYHKIGAPWTEGVQP